MSVRRTAGIAALVAAVGGIAGFLAYRSADIPPQPAYRPSITETTTPDSAPTESPTDQSIARPPTRIIPERLPDFELATVEGPPKRLSAFIHPVLVVNFWATWCAPCRREIPLLNRLRDERHATEGVEVVGIAVDFRDDVLKYLENTRIGYPLLMGEEDGLRAANAFGMDLLLPFTVFADAQRRIVTVKVGELHADEADFILDQIAALNAGQQDLAAVRLAIAAKLTELAAERARQPAEPAPGAAA